MFEAIHGSAPLIAGKNIANPSALLQAAIMMLVHIGQTDMANTLQNAWLCTLENGLHTADIYQPALSKEKLNTSSFANAVIHYLGDKPKTLPASHFQTNTQPIRTQSTHYQRQKKELVGIDIYLHWDEASRNPHTLGQLIESIHSRVFKLDAISNRGTDVYPQDFPETFCTDHWRLRFLAKPRNGQDTGIGFVTHADIIELLTHLQRLGLDFIKTEHLYRFNGKLGFSTPSGE
jgi:isocitrate dehydrogenase